MQAHLDSGVEPEMSPKEFHESTDEDNPDEQSDGSTDTDEFETVDFLDGLQSSLTAISHIGLGLFIAALFIFGGINQNIFYLGLGAVLYFLSEIAGLGLFR